MNKWASEQSPKGYSILEDATHDGRTDAHAMSNTVPMEFAQFKSLKQIFLQRTVYDLSLLGAPSEQRNLHEAVHGTTFKRNKSKKES